MTIIFKNICTFKASDHKFKYFSEFIKSSKHEESYELRNKTSVYFTDIGSGSFSASCLSNFSSVKIRSMRPMTRPNPRKTQLQTNPKCLNNSLNISKTMTPRPFKPRKYFNSALKFLNSTYR